jgi:asparagine synthetase B (glutamine-hydrolysing)
MYLFCSRSDDLIETARFSEAARHFGPIKIVSYRKSSLIWIDTPMSTCHQNETHIRIQIKLPMGIDSSPNTLDWNLTEHKLQFSRDWRGMFAVYVSKRSPVIVTSHKKLLPLCLKKSVPVVSLAAGAGGVSYLGDTMKPGIADAGKPRSAGEPNLSLDEAALQVRNLVVHSMRERCTDGMALLLSGGVDSTILAAIAGDFDMRLRTFTFALRRPPLPDIGLGSDRSCAAEASARYGHVHEEILLDNADLVSNIPISVYLGETARGTIVDELPAHVAMARFLHSRGIRQVLTGEGADDLFGAFPSALRFYRGEELRLFLQHELLVGLPDELAVVQNIYSFWGISLVLPYWTEELRSIGYWLPLEQRIDKQRLMKTVLRRAFADMVPEHLLSRPKGVPRDCTQIRLALESAYGTSPDRYRPVLSKMMERDSEWREKQLSTLRNS